VSAPSLPSTPRAGRRVAASIAALALGAGSAAYAMHREWSEAMRYEASEAPQHQVGEWFEMQVTGGPLSHPWRSQVRVVSYHSYDTLTPVRSLGTPMRAAGTDYILVIAECRCAVERKMGPPRTGIIDDRGWQWEHDGTMTAKEAGSAVSYLDVEGGEHADAKGVTRYAVVVPVASDASGLRVLLGGGIDPHVVGP